MRMQRMFQNPQLLLLATVMCCLLCATASAAAEETTVIQRAARLLQQEGSMNRTELEIYSQLLVRRLQAAHNGDKDLRKQLVAFTYMYAGCGGEARAEDPEVVAGKLKRVAQKMFVDGGVVNTYLEIVNEAMEVVRSAPPTAQECDRYYGGP